MHAAPRLAVDLRAPLLTLVALACWTGEAFSQSRPLVTPQPPAAPAAAPLAPALGDGAGALEDGLPLQGLVAHWTFAERGGAVAQDLAGGFDGQIEGAVRASEEPGPVLCFDGAGDRVLMPQEAVETIGALDQGSVALWFRFADFPIDGLQPLLHFGNDHTDDPDTMLIIEVGHPDNHQPQLNQRLYFTWIVDGVLPLCFDSGYDLEPDRWYHFVAIVGPEGNTGYLDGEEMVERRYNFGDADTVFFFSDLPLQEQLVLGRGKTSDFKTPDFVDLQGALADVRLYDRPLTAEEARALYEAAPAGARPVLGATGGLDG